MLSSDSFRNEEFIRLWWRERYPGCRPISSTSITLADASDLLERFKLFCLEREFASVRDRHL